MMLDIYKLKKIFLLHTKVKHTLLAFSILNNIFPLHTKISQVSQCALLYIII